MNANTLEGLTIRNRLYPLHKCIVQVFIENLIWRRLQNDVLTVLREISSNEFNNGKPQPLTTLTVSDENTRHKMGLSGR